MALALRSLRKLIAAACAGLIGAGLFAAGAAAQPRTDAASPFLFAEDVLASSAEHFPSILESLAQLRAAEGKALSAVGAFDLVFSVDGFDRVDGFWDGRIVDAQARQPLGPLGATVFGGYRISEGFFPIYEDEYFTNSGGEVRIGALFSVLRDRAIDDRRFGVADTRLAVEQADLEVLLTQLGVQHKALTAYWRWVASLRQAQVYERLLRIAEEREAGLEEQVRRGARAEIFLTENRQNILRRQRLATEARRDAMQAANALSFYYRDVAGAPLTPKDAQLPPSSAVEPLAALMIDEDPPVSRIIAMRPELQSLRVGLERARRRIELNRNDLKPQLDLRAEVDADLGQIAEGGESRDSTDTKIGLTFSVPLQRRGAKGRVRQAEAEREALRQQRRRIEDQIAVELTNILLNLEVSERLTVIADDEVAQALAMQDAERKRFQSGASDFFLLNIREETAADARIRYFIAELQTRIARANYDAATVNSERLMIKDPTAPGRAGAR
ncbi:MAG: TolC family protein [Pseudomonadota bacterium]